MNVNDITPVTMVKNEEYWIRNVLHNLLLAFPKVIMLDTGSNDRTKILALDLARTLSAGELHLIEEDYGNDAVKIGNGRNVLREAVKTHWMFLVDGDEVWLQSQLDALLAYELPENNHIAVLTGSKNVEDIDGKLQIRVYDNVNQDRLFSPEVRWGKRLDYPFESWGLTEDQKDRLHYIPAHEVFNYHMRHTCRSSQTAFFRDEKFGYFPYDKEYTPLDVTQFYQDEINPYFRA